tara:strand:+ start:2569 stop:3498 length:930 start_codon:yes stop_codon:yes gene_type:complete
MATKTISLDPQKSKRARSTLYANPKAMAEDSGTRNYKISERTIRSVEEGKKVKLSTAENYCTILGYGVNELAKIRTSEEVTNLEIDVSSTQIFGSCSENLLKDWRSHYSEDDKPPWSDLDVVRGTEREMSNYVKISTLVPASLEQILDCATDYKSCSKSFLQNKSHSHGFGGELNQVPYINHDLIWLLQSSITPDELIIGKLELIQKELSVANFNSPEKVPHSAESMVQRLKTSFIIREQVNSLNNQNQLRFLFGELLSECVNTFTKKTLAQGDFEYSQVKRKVLMLCHNTVELAQVKYNSWEVPKAIS